MENQLYHGLGVLVDDQVSVRASDVTIGCSRCDPFPRHPFTAEHRPYLLAGVLRVPLIHNVAEWDKVIVHLAVAVHAVIDGHKADAQFREADFCVKTYLQIVPAKPGHILDHDRAYQTRLNIGHHFDKARPLEVGAGVAVILVNLVVGDAVLTGVLGQYLDLMGDAVAVSLVLIITGEADIEGHPLLNQSLEHSHYRSPPIAPGSRL